MLTQNKIGISIALQSTFFTIMLQGNMRIVSTPYMKKQIQRREITSPRAHISRARTVSLMALSLVFFLPTTTPATTLNESSAGGETILYTHILSRLSTQPLISAKKNTSSSQMLNPNSYFKVWILHEAFHNFICL